LNLTVQASLIYYISVQRHQVYRAIIAAWVASHYRMWAAEQQ